MIGIRETEMIYRLLPHYVNILINSVVTKGGLRDKAPLIGSKIAKKRKLKGGITLLGARVGQGKTSTVNIFVDTFEKEKSLSDFTIAYLNTKGIKEDGLNFANLCKLSYEIMEEGKKEKNLKYFGTIIPHAV